MAEQATGSMDYALSDDQQALVDSLQALLAGHRELPQAARLAFQYFDADLQARLQEAGYLDAGRELGALEAALVVIETARLPAVVEAGASALVLPQLPGAPRLPGPVALLGGDALSAAHRNLPIARSMLIDLGDHVVAMAVEAGSVLPVATILGYPYGRLRAAPDLARGQRLGGDAPERLRQWRRVALAAEMAGAAHSAVEFTVAYVKQRQVFGRAIGSFQAVQHRLAQCHQIARGMHFLTLRAAWSGTPQDADLAACYAQQHVSKFMFDLHQFNGAMGVTNENLLHFWTYRLRALQSEAGGAAGAALAIADRLWGAAQPTAPAAVR